MYRYCQPSFHPPSIVRHKARNGDRLFNSNSIFYKIKLFQFLQYFSKGGPGPRGPSPRSATEGDNHWTRSPRVWVRASFSTSMDRFLHSIQHVHYLSIEVTLLIGHRRELT